MALFLAFPAQERSGNERELVRVYLMAVEDIDADSVASACKRFIKGLVVGANHTFRPTPAELATEARKQQAHATERKRIAQLPRAPASRALPEPDEARMPSPERRKELADKARAIMAQFGGS